MLPTITAKLLRRDVVIASAGSGFKVAQAQKDPLANVSAFLQSITYHLSDRIIMYSEKLVEEHSLQKHRCKISIAHEHILNFDNFKVKKEIEERCDLVGYIGALSKAKGIVQLLQAIPCVLGREGRVTFLIGGDGELRGEVEKISNNNSLNKKVKFIGWIHHDLLPKYMNDLKLLVLPSYTEGLPNIMLEAMACGTPVLATPVGAIPDIITDGETGFLMLNNSSECIAANVIRALEHPDLEGIAKRARTLVESEFTFDKAVERWGKILEEISEGK